MEDYIGQNKKAYDFWTQQRKPKERDKADRANPIGQLKKYANRFDVVFMEGGILHYFHDIDEFSA